MFSSSLVRRCVAVDLEVRRGSETIDRFAAIRGDASRPPLVFHGGNLEPALRHLEQIAEDADFLAGHNLIAFDRPRLAAAAPGLPLLHLPVIDTLRLSPLAFPRNPYHRLVKHYKDGVLVRSRRNDPELDARLCLQLLADEETALAGIAAENPPLLAAWHWLASLRPENAGAAAVFEAARGLPPQDATAGHAAVLASLQLRACEAAAKRLLDDPAAHVWPISYSLAWISVSGGNSVPPPWVRYEFPETGRLLRRLRDSRCGDDACAWCDEHHNPKRVLKRWFGFSEYRPEPACDDGRSMQEAIVEAAMRGENVLAILPTGTGKSVCYQAPALSRYENTGALTVVISPLVALMADQVYGLKARGITACAALNGLLSMTERYDVLEKIRLGDIAILLASPEQLRNRGFRKAVQQREIGAWVLDEAHCLSKWGHDFRTDYRYIGKYIREAAASDPPPPVLCLTATAKPDVIKEIRDYFVQSLDVELRIFNGGSSRANLEYAIAETEPERKYHAIHELLGTHLPKGETGGAIVYCATRAQTEEMARFLAGMNWAASFYHAGLKPEAKKSTQEQFISGQLRVIAATNAFGMGIDKPDVRLVIHAEIPGSLENYVQEAGRAGRDQRPAACLLLFCEKDVEWQFGLSSRSRLAQDEIKAVLRALRRSAGKRRNPAQEAEVIATPGEILSEVDRQEFMRDSATDDTRIRTAVAWLEEAKLVTREENRYQVFPSSLRIATLEDADTRIADLEAAYRDKLRRIAEALLCADPAEGVTTDELAGVSSLSSSEVQRAMHELERRGVLSNDTVVTALVHAGIENASRRRFERAAALEMALIDTLREFAPDLEKGGDSVLHLRRASQHLKDGGHTHAQPELLFRLLQGMASDNRSEEEHTGSVRLRKLDAESVQLTMQRDWEPLRETAARRQAAARLLMEHLLSRLPPGARGADLLAETTMGQLQAAVEADLLFAARPKYNVRLVERALLWLHEQNILRLGKGLTVFRPAMTIRVAPGNASFNAEHYAALEDHYREQVVQIHVMAEYARRGLRDARLAVRLTSDYFTLAREEFLRRWFSNPGKDLSRQTTDASWQNIVESLNRVQRDIVTDDRERTNVLVLAGPGSGKTRVLVHRIAYLVRVRREASRGILALAYNRHAAADIRRRLRDLIGEDANGVTVLTCHAMAMRLTGHSFADRTPNSADFQEVLAAAVALLKGEGLPPEEADGQRDRLLAGFRWILVDEYQDIDRPQYELIAALAGRTLNDPERRLSLLAVGDDDQNIYAFNGASVEFIRRFREDYRAKPSYLVANYRSTANIIEAANALIAPAEDRMKTGHPIEIDEDRRRAPRGGDWEKKDPVVCGRVQILKVDCDFERQAEMVMLELLRLAQLDRGWDWTRVAVIARQWHALGPVRAYCEAHGIPVHHAREETPRFWRLRESQKLAAWLEGRGARPLERGELNAWLARQDHGQWWELLEEAAAEYWLECGGGPMPATHFREWLAEWGQEVRHKPRGLVLLTAHQAKGLEFDHVVVLDGDWNDRDSTEDPDSARRLYYVAMTRARHTLTLARMSGANYLLNGFPELPAILRRESPRVENPTPGLDRCYEVLSPKNVDLGFAGRYGSNHPIHSAIAALRPGDALHLDSTRTPWQLKDALGVQVGTLAKKFLPPHGMRYAQASVHAILVWTQDDGDHFRSPRCDRWEVVLPRLVFTRNRT